MFLPLVPLIRSLVCGSVSLPFLCFRPSPSVLHRCRCSGFLLCCWVAVFGLCFESLRLIVVFALPVSSGSSLLVSCGPSASVWFCLGFPLCLSFCFLLGCVALESRKACIWSTVARLPLCNGLLLLFNIPSKFNIC